MDQRERDYWDKRDTDFKEREELLMAKEQELERQRK